MSSTQFIYEQTLVVRAQLGDESAFEELLTLYGTRIFRFVSKMMQSSPQIAEDITQEVWLAIFKGLPRLLEPGKFRPWAFRIARDRIYREYRRRKIPIERIDDNLDIIDDTSDANALFDQEELLASLDALSPQHREVLVLFYLEEMSYEEISRATGASLGTVRSRIHYAKRSLKNLLERKPDEPRTP